MASIVKDKKIFNFGGFRGIDTENKPDKVERFRAISGKNFYIDGNTLKTRPALVNNKKYNLDGNILGSYFFNGTEIIFTDTNKIYFLRGDENFFTDGLSKNADEKVFTNVTSFFFNNARPFFVQEKNCLFIFCVGDVLILSSVANNENYAFVVYRINNKFSYDFDINFSTYCSQEVYNELPDAYVPTIQIGDNFYEDVNLLSNKRKYKLFNKNNPNDLFTEYYLLGDYDPQKHGDLQDATIDVSFYGKNINSMSQIPIFLGVQGEALDYDSLTDDYWVFPNNNTSGTIEEETLSETFVATEIWDFLDFEEGHDAQIDAPISQFVGLTKEQAFNFLLSNKTSIFEYLENVDLSAYSSLYSSKDIIFKVKINVEIMYRTKDANGIVTSYANKAIVQRYIYFGFHKTSSLSVWNLTSENYHHLGSKQETTTNFPTSYFATLRVDSFYEENAQEYPDPEVGGVINTPYYKSDEDNTLYLFSVVSNRYEQVCVDYPNTFINGQFDSDTLSLEKQNIVISWFKSNYNFPADILEAQIRVKSYKPKTTSYTLSHDVDINSFNNTFLRTESSYLTISVQEFNETDYPTIDIVGKKPFIIIECGVSSETMTFFNDNNYNVYGEMLNTIRATLTNKINDGKYSAKEYYIIIHFYEKRTHNGNFQSGKKHTLWIKSKLSKTADDVQYVHSFHILHLNRSVVANNFFEIIYDGEGLKAKIINKLINYKNEPAIDISISFANNNYNYSLIANSKFGTTFGSENRLFLAGNPDFKHIDRYNVSNDLLGNNVKSQSYELSYFPSKNYRVVGSDSSSINGYVVANDTQLYVTKTQAINDSCLYIRTRTTGDNGLVSFFEYKTNINKTPINERCIVNFYNDIVMLTKDGLLGIEISSNVLTNERLLKLRSGFINKELSTAVKNASSVWCIDDSERLYMFIDNLVYVADARYISANENSQISNVSYEIVKWELDKILHLGFLKDGSLIFYDEARSYFFEEDIGKDEIINVFSAGELAFTSDGATITASVFNEMQNENKITFTRKNILDTNKIILGKVFDTSEIILTGGNWTITQDILDTFAKRTGEYMDDLKFYIYSGGVYTSFTSSIEVGTQVALNDGDEIFVNIYGKPLYITKTETTGYIKLQMSLRDAEFFTVIGFSNCVFADFDYFYNASKIIQLEWYSGVLDFGDKLYEKTMFEITFYARKLKSGNLLKYGYRTMRGYKETSNDVEVDISNSISFDETNFNIFAVSKFDNVAITRKQKENNFLYIQFIFKCEGSVEISDIIVYYKNNRKTKLVS